MTKMRKVQKYKNNEEEERQKNDKQNKEVDNNDFQMKNRMHHSNLSQRNIGNREQKQRPKTCLNEEN